MKLNKEKKKNQLYKKRINSCNNSSNDNQRFKICKRFRDRSLSEVGVEKWVARPFEVRTQKARSFEDGA